MYTDSNGTMTVCLLAAGDAAELASEGACVMLRHALAPSPKDWASLHVCAIQI